MTDLMAWYFGQKHGVIEIGSVQKYTLSRFLKITKGWTWTVIQDKLQSRGINAYKVDQNRRPSSTDKAPY